MRFLKFFSYGAKKNWVYLGRETLFWWLLFIYYIVFLINKA